MKKKELTINQVARMGGLSHSPEHMRKLQKKSVKKRRENMARIKASEVEPLND